MRDVMMSGIMEKGNRGIDGTFNVVVARKRNEYVMPARLSVVIVYSRSKSVRQLNELLGLAAGP